jgi:hypothetical protein
VIDIPLGVLVLLMLFMFLLAGMAYEAYIRPRLLTHSLKTKMRRKPHMIIRARKI